jgi:hypothetical protein
MPDITMCENIDCIKKSKCYRYMAKPSSMQSYAYFMEVPCKDFVHIEGRDIRNEKGSERTPEPKKQKI